ncbi:family 43 glycosylhydrolase [Paenibacillus oryzisoli]|uniref:family 43 glycosylhydrolase n=1 Tax=Paenibacillus oryzisoli TaxID=1850517 RepID=UPI003D282654
MKSLKNFFKGLLLMTVFVLLTLGFVVSAAAATQFTNPILSNATNPAITYDGGYYYAVHTRPGGTNYIAVRKAERLSDLEQAEEIHVYNVPSGQSAVWAPEMFKINNKWYIYYCADTNHDRQIFVLESTTSDALGSYTSKGELSLPFTRNIDPSIFTDETTGESYLLWTYSTMSDNKNRNYIAHLSNPWTVDSSPVLITEPTYSWEASGRPITEAPIALQKNGKTFIFYSGSAAVSNYCVGVVYNTDGDFLNPNSWTKMSTPILSGNSTILAPGHNGLFKSPDGTEDWMVYHARQAPWNSNDWNWVAHKMTWDANGFPEIFTPDTWGVTVNGPSGEPVNSNEIIIDNGETGFTTDSSWTTSTSVSGYYGTNYKHDGTSGADSSSRWAKWTPQITTAGRYNIYMRWVNDPVNHLRPDAAPVEIKYDGGTDTSKSVNQQINNGTWVLIGTYDLSAGTNNYVKILATDAGYTIADAVKFVKN